MIALAIVDVGAIGGALLTLALVALLIVAVRRGIVVRLRDERHPPDDHER